MEVFMESPLIQETRNKPHGLVDELLNSPEGFDRFVNDPVLFEAFAKTITDEAVLGEEKLSFDDFTIELSLKDIVD